MKTSAVRVKFFTLPIETNKFSKKEICCNGSQISNFQFKTLNGARESKIPPFDSESRLLSNCILRFFSKKIDLPTLFSFHQSFKFKAVVYHIFLGIDFYHFNNVKSCVCLWGIEVEKSSGSRKRDKRFGRII